MAGIRGKSGPPGDQNAFRHGLAGINQRRANGALNPTEQSIREEILVGLLADKGAIVAGGVLYVIASGAPGFDVSKGFASNGYGVHSPGGYSLLAALVSEVVMTMFFLLIILGATDKRTPAGFAPIAIGLALTLIHLISIPVTNTSVNPARSTGVALFVGGWAIGQLWLFWVAPIMGALLGATTYHFIASEEAEDVRPVVAPEVFGSAAILR